MDKMTEFCSHAALRTVIVLAWYSPVIFGQGSESFEIVQELSFSIERRRNKGDLLLYWRNHRRNHPLLFRISNYFFNLVNVAIM